MDPDQGIQLVLVSLISDNVINSHLSIETILYTSLSFLKRIKAQPVNNQYCHQYTYCSPSGDYTRIKSTLKYPLDKLKSCLTALLHRVWIRSVYNQWPTIVRSPHSKPLALLRNDMYIPTSISHHGPYIGLVFLEQDLLNSSLNTRVGLDIASISDCVPAADFDSIDDVVDLYKSILSGTEALWLKSLNSFNLASSAFTLLWAIKESVVKLMGCGLTDRFDSVFSSINPDVATLSPLAYSATDNPDFDHSTVSVWVPFQLRDPLLHIPDIQQGLWPRNKLSMLATWLDPDHVLVLAMDLAGTEYQASKMVPAVTRLSCTQVLDLAMSLIQ